MSVAERLRAAGYDVVVWDLSGGDIDCDISDPDAVSAAMERTVRDRGVPTPVVTCAGVGASGMLVRTVARAPVGAPGAGGQS